MESYSYGKADGGTLALENTDLSLKTNSNTSLLKWTKASYLISLSFSFLVLKKKDNKYFSHWIIMNVNHDNSGEHL